MGSRYSTKDTILFIITGIAAISWGIYLVIEMINSTQEWYLLRDDFVQTTAVTISRSRRNNRRTIVYYQFTSKATGREYAGQAGGSRNGYPSKPGDEFLIRYYPSNPNIVWTEKAFQGYWRSLPVTIIFILLWFSWPTFAVYSLVTGPLWLLDEEARRRR